MAKKIAKKKKSPRAAKGSTRVAKKKPATAGARSKKASPLKNAPAKAAKKAARKGAAKKAAKRAVPAVAKRAAPAVAKRAVPSPKGVRVKPGKRPARASPLKASPAPRKERVKAAPPPIRRRDGSGHLDPKYAADLLAQSGAHQDEGRAFLARSRSHDGLAEELGEEFVQAATSGEADGEESLNQEVSEELGGPFVTSTGGTEFAEGTDESNPITAEREPFPRT